MCRTALLCPSTILRGGIGFVYGAPVSRATIPSLSDRLYVTAVVMSLQCFHRQIKQFKLSGAAFIFQSYAALAAFVKDRNHLRSW